MKSATGRLVSTRRADLDEICDFFSLQIDNPMTVLSQDMARQFLNSSSPYDKYKFFMKGTQLEHLDGDYAQMEQSIEEIEQSLLVRQKDLELVQEQAKRASESLKMSKRQDTLRNRIETVANQMAWAQVEEQEGGQASLERSLRKKEQDIEGASQKATVASKVFTDANEASVEADDIVQRLKAERVPAVEEKQRVKAEHEADKAEALKVQVSQ